MGEQVVKLLKLAPDLTAYGASFSPCQRYRYALWREWDATKPIVAFVGLNPSTADAEWDDPALQSVQRLARAWGFGRVTMLNAFAWRSTDPDGLIGLDDPVGPENDSAITAVAGEAGRIVFAWGRFQKIRGMVGRRTFVLRRLLRRSACEVGHRGLNADGSPKHPLFLKGTTEFVRTELS